MDNQQPLTKPAQAQTLNNVIGAINSLKVDGSQADLIVQIKQAVAAVGNAIVQEISQTAADQKANTETTEVTKKTRKKRVKKETATEESKTE